MNIESHVKIGFRNSIEVGDNSGLGRFMNVPNDIVIGRDVMIAPDVLFINQDHKFMSLDTPMRVQGKTNKAKFVIEDDVWIGQRVIILPRASFIGRGSIIGAGSVVTKPIPPYSIVGGNPARIIKSRCNEDNLD